MAFKCLFLKAAITRIISVSLAQESYNFYDIDLSCFAHYPCSLAVNCYTCFSFSIAMEYLEYRARPSKSLTLVATNDRGHFCTCLQTMYRAQLRLLDPRSIKVTSMCNASISPVVPACILSHSKMHHVPRVGVGVT